jgi:poly-beta-1,6-N-acetyl-D-glucosamine synthase
MSVRPEKERRVADLGRKRSEGPGPGCRHLIVTPVKNEAAFIGDMIESMLKQTLPPVRWILVDDGSDDDTVAIVERYLSRAPHMQLVRARLAGGRALGGRVVELFRRGLQEVDPAQFDFVTKMDGDLVLPPDYLARLTARFLDDPRLGIAGGACYLRRGAKEQLERVPARHVRGALKTYRREAFEAIGGLEAGLGWDTLDLVRAQMAGWSTRSFPDLRVWHRRPTASVGGRLRGRVRLGHTAWRLGYDPWFLLGRAVRAGLRESPFLLGGVAMLCGFLWSAIQREARFLKQEEMEFLRRQQRRRLRRFGRDA